MAEPTKLVPERVPSWQMPYWESLRVQRVTVQKCLNCGTLRHIPKELCPRCHQTEYEWQPISGEGTVFTYTVVHRAPTPAYQADAPYVLVHVQMAEGVRMIADLVGVPAAVRIGLPVKAVFDDVDPHWTLLRFTPA